MIQLSLVLRACSTASAVTDTARKVTNLDGAFHNAFHYFKAFKSNIIMNHTLLSKYIYFLIIGTNNF